MDKRTEKRQLPKIPVDAVRASPKLGRLSGATDADSKERRWIRDMAAVLLENLFAGDQIQKSRIPPSLVLETGTTYKSVISWRR